MLHRGSTGETVMMRKFEGTRAMGLKSRGVKMFSGRVFPGMQTVSERMIATTVVEGAHSGFAVVALVTHTRVGLCLYERLNEIVAAAAHGIAGMWIEEHTAVAHKAAVAELGGIAAVLITAAAAAVVRFVFPFVQPGTFAVVEEMNYTLGRLEYHHAQKNLATVGGQRKAVHAEWERENRHPTAQTPIQTALCAHH